MILTKDKTFEEFCDRCGTSCTERTIDKCKREVEEVKKIKKINATKLRGAYVKT